MPQQKINLFGQFKGPGLDTSKSDMLRSLAGLTQQVSDVALSIGNQKMAKKGAIEGAQQAQQSFEAGEQLPESNSFFGAQRENYNRAAVMTYRAQIQMDNRKELDRLENEHRLDPEGFENSAQALKQGALSSMPPELSVMVSQDMDESISNRRAKLQDGFFKREQENQSATALESIETNQDDILNLTREGRIDEQVKLISKANLELEQWVAADIISPEQARKIREDTAERILEQEALKGIEDIVFNDKLSLDEQLEKGVDFVEKLRKSELKDLSPEQKDSLLRVVESKLNGVMNKKSIQSNQRDIAKEKIVSNLKVVAGRLVDAASNGESVDLDSIVEQTETLHNKGDITESERTSIITKVAKAHDEINRISLADKRILARMSGDESITMDKGDVDSFWKRNVKDDVDQLDPQSATLATANFITQTRSIPTQVKNQITSNILSGNPDLIKQSAELVDRIDGIPGMAEMAVDANQRAFISHVVALNDSLGPEEAIKIAKELTDPRDKARVEERTNYIKSKKLKEDYKDIVDSSFSQYLGNDLQDNVNIEQVTKEYSEMFESFFKAGSSESESKEKALQVLKANWKDSQFGFMKHPPETYYNVNGNTEYIKTQLVSELTAGTIGLEINPDNVFLLSDESTERQASQGQPSYRIMIKTDAGLSFPTMTDENGKPSNRWMPDAKKERDSQLERNKIEFEKKRQAETKGKDKQKEILKARFGL
jgi:hypothetical protein